MALSIRRIRFNPITLRRWARFRSIRRGYFSFLALIALGIFAAMGPLLVGNRALVVRYEGTLFFPVFAGSISGTSFGLPHQYEPNYRQLQRVFREEGKGNFVILPPVPFSGREVIDIVESVPHDDGKFMDRTASPPRALRESKIFTLHENGQPARMFAVVDGEFHGTMRGFDRVGVRLETARFDKGTLVEWKNPDNLPLSAFVMPSTESLYRQLPAPTRPGIGGHLLGTDASGRDVLARCFDGFRIQVLASIIYVLFTLLFGITLGCAMGYFGGAFDLGMQRLVEIWSNVPFLYIVIIISSFITPSLFTLMIILVAFSWMGLTYYMRSETYREKERDYVQAARMMGASTFRILFRHILPNILSTVITFIPFYISSVIAALTSLDFLGFGLPPTDPSWGDLLKQGQAHRASWWILSTVFTSMVSVLVLVTFVGEAMREAFDPKKYTVYQ